MGTAPSGELFKYKLISTDFYVGTGAEVSRATFELTEEKINILSSNGKSLNQHCVLKQQQVRRYAVGLGLVLRARAQDVGSFFR